MTVCVTASKCALWPRVCARSLTALTTPRAALTTPRPARTTPRASQFGENYSLLELKYPIPSDVTPWCLTYVNHPTLNYLAWSLAETAQQHTLYNIHVHVHRIRWRQGLQVKRNSAVTPSHWADVGTRRGHCTLNLYYLTNGQSGRKQKCVDQCDIVRKCDTTAVS